MRRDRTGSASAARDAGLRRVTRLTWQLAAAGAACSALIAAAFGHGVSQHGASAIPRHTASTPRSGPHGQQGRPGKHPLKHHRQDGSGSGSGLQIPAQPPAPSPGAGQVTSGAS